MFYKNLQKAERKILNDSVALSHAADNLYSSLDLKYFHGRLFCLRLDIQMVVVKLQ